MFRFLVVIYACLLVSCGGDQPDDPTQTTNVFDWPDTSAVMVYAKGNFEFPPTAPSYEQLCAHFGFAVPRLLHDLLTVAYQVDPNAPSEVLDSFGLVHPFDPKPAVPLTLVDDFPALIPFAGDGGGGTYGMLAVHPPQSAEDFSVGYTNYVDGPEVSVAAVSVRDFVLVRILRCIEDRIETDPETQSEQRRASFITAFVPLLNPPLEGWDASRPYHQQSQLVEKQLMESDSPYSAFSKQHPGVNADVVMKIE